jgi:hypothetical protein
MRLTKTILVGLFAISAATFSQAQTTTTQTETKTVTITGEVLSYEPGRTIVIRDPSQKTVTFTLTPSVTVPQDVQVGRTVTLDTATDPSGVAMVRRVTTTSVTPEGQTKQTTEETRTNAAGDTTRTTTTTITGMVKTYETGKSITVTRSDGTQVTYVLSPQSDVPSDLAIGKEVTILVDPSASAAKPIAKKVTYKIKTKE